MLQATSFRIGICQRRCQESRDTMIIQTNSIGNDIISDCFYQDAPPASSGA